MAAREELSTLISYVLGETNRQLLITSGLDAVPKESRIAALRGLQDLGWLGHNGYADFEESYSLTMEGRRIAAEKPPISALDPSVREHIEALREADSSSDTERKRGLRRLIAIEREIGSLDSALLNCFELRKVARRTNDVESMAFAFYYEGVIETAQNRWDEALESLLTAVEMYMEIGDRRGVAMANRSLGVVYGNRGDHASAIRCFESSLDIARSLGDRALEAMAEGNLAIIYDLEGRTEESEMASRRCLEYFLEAGDHARAARAANNLGVLNMSRERFDAAKEYFEKTIASARELRNAELLGIALVNAGYCHARSGDLYTALSYSDEALKILKEHYNLNMLALAYRNYGYIELRSSNPAAAFEWFEKSIRAAEGSGVEDTLAACCYEYGMALIETATNPRLGAKLLKKASKIYRSLGNTEKLVPRKDSQRRPDPAAAGPHMVCGRGGGTIRRLAPISIPQNQACPPVWAFTLEIAVFTLNHAWPPSGATPSTASAAVIPSASTPAANIQSLLRLSPP